MHRLQLNMQLPFAACAQVQQLAAGDCASVALLWDVAELLRSDAEPKQGALEASPGAIVIANPSDDAAGTADGEADARVAVGEEAQEAADAASAGVSQEAEDAVYSSRAQVIPAA